MNVLRHVLRGMFNEMLSMRDKEIRSQTFPFISNTQYIYIRTYIVYLIVNGKNEENRLVFITITLLRIFT